MACVESLVSLRQTMPGDCLRVRRMASVLRYHPALPMFHDRIMPLLVGRVLWTCLLYTSDAADDM
eukprot:3868455-Rhodomonas_salina.1